MLRLCGLLRFAELPAEREDPLLEREPLLRARVDAADFALVLAPEPFDDLVLLCALREAALLRADLLALDLPALDLPALDLPAADLLPPDLVLAISIPPHSRTSLLRRGTHLYTQ